MWQDDPYLAQINMTCNCIYQRYYVIFTGVKCTPYLQLIVPLFKKSERFDGISNGIGECEYDYRRESRILGRGQPISCSTGCISSPARERRAWYNTIHNFAEFVRLNLIG